MVKDFASKKDLTVFLETSGTSTRRFMESKALLSGCDMFAFGVTSANAHAIEDELHSGLSLRKRQEKM